MTLTERSQHREGDPAKYKHCLTLIYCAGFCPESHIISLHLDISFTSQITDYVVEMLRDGNTSAAAEVNPRICGKASYPDVSLLGVLELKQRAKKGA